MSIDKTIELWPVEKLVPYIRNPRKNDDAVYQFASDRQRAGQNPFREFVKCLEF